MDIVLAIDGGAENELRLIRERLRDMPGLDSLDLHEVRVDDPDKLGAEAMLQFIGEAVLLPLILQSLYDYLRSRRHTRTGENLSLTIVRKDLPNGTRTVKLTLDGPADKVLEAARRELES
jgi:hypothetical protein